MTDAGMILGTAAYMAPEQAKGRAADKRCDVWAFGCVLYEMLTGKRAFEGEDVSDTLAAVLRGEPDWAALPADVPAAMRTLIRRCLAKDRRQRIADIAVALFVLDDPASVAPATAAPGQLRDDRATTTALAAHGHTFRHVAHRRRDGRHRRLVRHARHHSAAPRVALPDHPAERGGADRGRVRARPGPHA